MKSFPRSSADNFGVRLVESCLPDSHSHLKRRRRSLQMAIPGRFQQPAAGALHPPNHCLALSPNSCSVARGPSLPLIPHSGAFSITPIFRWTGRFAFVNFSNQTGNQRHMYCFVLFYLALMSCKIPRISISVCSKTFF